MAMTKATLARKGYDQMYSSEAIAERFDTNFLAFSLAFDAVYLPIVTLMWAVKVARGTATTREAASGLAQYVILSVAMMLAFGYKWGDNR